MTDLPEGALAPAAARPRLSWPEIRYVIATVSTPGFLGAYAAPWFAAMPQGADNDIGQMQGALITQWADIMCWYFGSSQSAGAARDQLGQVLAKLPDAQS